MNLQYEAQLPSLLSVGSSILLKGNDLLNNKTDYLCSKIDIDCTRLYNSSVSMFFHLRIIRQQFCETPQI